MAGFGLGSLIDVFSPPETSVASFVKDPAMQQRIGELSSDYDTTRSTGKKALSQWTNDFLAKDPVFRSQETKSIDRYYNGDMDNILAGLRAQRASAMRTAGDRALAYATRDRNSSILGGSGGGGSSYLTRLGLRNAGDIEAQIAMDAANQNRADLDALEARRLGLIGARTGILDRSMEPAWMSQKVAGGNAQLLAQILGLNQANNITGLKSERNPWAAAADAIDTGIMNAASTFGSIAGAVRGGGGGGVNPQTSPGINSLQLQPSNSYTYSSAYQPGTATGGWDWTPQANNFDTAMLS